MHRCLTIEEMQRAIFQQVCNEPRFSLYKSPWQGKATLARLARTCRTFNKVALDILWEDLLSIRYLVQCLPTDLWTSDYPGGMIKFRRAMSRSDWELLFRYSSRIRSLRLDCTSSLDDNVIITLSQPLGGGPLTPNLKTLSWKNPADKFLPLLEPLLPRSLVYLQLPYLVLRSSQISTHLMTRCPSLKNLHIVKDRIQIKNEDQTSLSEIFLHLRSLRSLELELHALDKSAIINLSQLPSLTKLSGRLCGHLQLENVIPYLTPPTFQSLEFLALGLVDNELSALTSLLKVARFKLQGVSLTLDITPTTDMLSLFFAALLNACDSQRFSHMALTSGIDDWRYVLGPASRIINRPQIFLSTFEPLLALPNVEHFTFDLICNIFLDDNAINTLTKHWPKLTDLSFNTSLGWGTETGVTHRGLITLLSRCASLANFALTVDFSDIEEPTELISPSRRSDGINDHCRSADFVTSKIKFPLSVAAFLSEICPRLDVVTSIWSADYMEETQNEESEEDISTYRKRWMEVSKVLPGFLAVRRQYVDSSASSGFVA